MARHHLPLAPSSPSMDSNRDAGAARREHVAPAPPPIFTGTTEWSPLPSDLRGHGLPPGRSPLVWQGPFAEELPMLQVSHRYAPPPLGFVGRGQPETLGAASLAPDVDARRVGSLMRRHPGEIVQLRGGPRGRHHPARPRALAAGRAGLIGLVNRVVWEPESLGSLRHAAAHMGALDGYSSSHWQGLLEDGDEACVANTLSVVLGFVFELMTGHVGHHLFQTMVRACGEAHLGVIVSAVAAQGSRLVDAAKNRHGKECVEQLVMAVRAREPMVRQLTAALAVDAAGLMKDDYGYDLIRTCLRALDADHNAFIYQAALADLEELAKCKYGCLALCSCIDHAPAPIKDDLVAGIISNAASLAEDPSGNYIVQHVLRLNNRGYKDRMCRELKHYCLQLSTQKHGSPVVETCIESTGWTQVVEVLVSHMRVDEMAQHPFGNFVVQSLLRRLKKEPSWYRTYRQMVESLVAEIQSLKHHCYGKHVLKLLFELEGGE